MSSQVKQSQPVKQTNRENFNSRPVKAVLQPAKTLTSTGRLALGEVGNKINPTTVQNGTKPKVFKAPTDVKKKPTLAIIKKAASIDIPSTKVSDKCSVKSGRTDISLQKECVLGKTTSKLPPLKSTQESLSYSTKQLIEIIDIDTSDNPLHVSEYIQDIYKYLLSLEDKYCTKRNFLEGHKSTPRMRAILVNWMAEIHINFKLLLETLHLSVSIVDRYLQMNKNIGRSTLQLVGTVAMFIAAKYEEMYVPDISDFVYICDDTFSNKQILEMERDILSKLEFNLGRPISLQFLRRFNRIANAQSQHHTLGKYMLELALVDYELCQIKPSLQAAAACCLAISILDELIDPSKAWTEILVHYTNYTYSAIKSVVISMACALNSAEVSKHQCIRTKYSSANYFKISVHPKLKCLLIKKLIAQAADSNKK